MAEGILSANGLVKRFDGLAAVDGVDFSLKMGEIRALIGPNGAGKTTLINLLAGQLPPDSGVIYLMGRDITRWPAHRRARAGLARTFQIGSLFPNLSVRRHIEAALAGGRLKLRRSKALEGAMVEILKLCRLEGKQDLKARELSHGDLRLLELGIALASRPKVLLLDEPTAGLSPAETGELIELISQLKGMAILIVEHDMEVVFRLAQVITVMHRGKVIAEGAPQGIERDPKVQEVYLGGV
jgi:branched-chain amino acid transport system ATP-binding protein